MQNKQLCRLSRTWLLSFVVLIAICVIEAVNYSLLWFTVHMCLLFLQYQSLAWRREQIENKRGVQSFLSLWNGAHAIHVPLKFLLLTVWWTLSKKKEAHFHCLLRCFVRRPLSRDINLGSRAWFLSLVLQNGCRLPLVVRLTPLLPFLPLPADGNATSVQQEAHAGRCEWAVRGCG